MIQIRLCVAFTFDHCEIPEGAVIGVTREIAETLVSRGVAEFAVPEHAVIQPDETRANTNRERLKHSGRRLN